MKASRVAIVGAGPIGIEAALEGVRRGFEVSVYDAGRVAAHWRCFASVKLFTPFGMNSTARGRARLRATGVDLPKDDAILTAGEIVARYLEPLSRLPVLNGRIHEREKVTQIGREGLTKSGGVGGTENATRAGRPFLLRVEPLAGPPRIDRADFVLDATGVYATPRATGPGGLSALGEETLGARIDRHVVSVRGEARSRYEGKRVLLVGDGHSAATVLVELAVLATEGAAPTVTWITRRGVGSEREPFMVQPGDPLPERAGLGEKANRIAREASWLTTRAGSVIESYEVNDGTVTATVRDPNGEAGRIHVDQVLALVGYRPDASIHRELHVHLCYASEGPMALASAMLAASAANRGAGSDCLKQSTHGAETLRNPEPGFFLLGAKSYGRNQQFLLSVGHRQIEEIYGLIEADLAAPVAGVAR